MMSNPALTGSGCSSLDDQCNGTRLADEQNAIPDQCRKKVPGLFFAKAAFYL